MSGVAGAIVAGSLLYSALSQIRFEAQQAEHRRRMEAAAAPPTLPRHGRGRLSAVVEHRDRAGERAEVVAGNDDRDVVRAMAAQAIRPGTQTRIGGPPPPPPQQPQHVGEQRGRRHDVPTGGGPRGEDAW
jgi:hypothetical protein